MNAFGAYAAVAVAGGIGSVAIAGIGFKSFSTITDEGMWAIAVMAAAPAVMAVLIAGFVHWSHLAEVRGRRPYPAGRSRGADDALPEGRGRGSAPSPEGGYSPRRDDG